MIHVFENGRILYDSSLLKSKDKGKYISVEKLPTIKVKEGFNGYCVANLVTNEIDIKYVEAIKTEDNINEEIEPLKELSQLDRIENSILSLQSDVAQKAIDEYTVQLMKEGVLWEYL